MLQHDLKRFQVLHLKIRNKQKFSQGLHKAPVIIELSALV